LIVKTIDKRIEELEKRKNPTDILVLWGDYDNPDICRLGDDVFTWAEAEQRFGKDYVLICVKYAEGDYEND